MGIKEIKEELNEEIKVYYSIMDEFAEKIKIADKDIEDIGKELGKLQKLFIIKKPSEIENVLDKITEITEKVQKQAIKLIEVHANLGIYLKKTHNFSDILIADMMRILDTTMETINEKKKEMEKKEIVNDLILSYDFFIEVMFKVGKVNGRTQKLQIDFSELLGKMFGLLSVLRGFMEEHDAKKLKNDLIKLEQELKELEEKKFFIGLHGIKEMKDKKR